MINVEKNYQERLLRRSKVKLALGQLFPLRVFADSREATKESE
jgi:hypothetical protein